MRIIALLALLGAGLAGGAGAQEAAAQEAGAPSGDPARGETLFDRQCVSCHVVQDPGGEVLAGRNARVGPNLWGVAGRVAGSLPGYDYSALMEAYGATGATWEEANFVPYVQDPTGFLRGATGEGGRSKMAYQVRDAADAPDLWAYLATFGDPAGGEAAGEAAPAEAASE